MFSEIVFGSFLLVIGTVISGSAANPCPTALAAFKDIRDPIPVFEDETGEYCFFRLSEMDENSTNQEDKVDKTMWSWVKDKAVSHCKKYGDAFLPRLKNENITKYFTDKKQNGIVEITWDDGDTLKIDTAKGVHNNAKRKFYIYTDPKFCKNVVYLNLNDGGWGCYEPFLNVWTAQAFCQYKIPGGASATTPKGASPEGFILKVIVAATTSLAIYQTSF